MEEMFTPERYKQLPIYSWDDDSIIVDPRCTYCGRFISKARVLHNALDEVKFEGWFCYVCHKEVEPHWERTC